MNDLIFQRVGFIKSCRGDHLCIAFVVLCLHSLCLDEKWRESIGFDSFLVWQIVIPQLDVLRLQTIHSKKMLAECKET